MASSWYRRIRLGSSPPESEEKSGAPAFEKVLAATLQESRDETRPTPLALPATVVAVFAEMTGHHATDRLVSFAAVKLETAALSGELIRLKPLHLVFDPGRRSEPRREAAHGYDDWLLRHQPEFSGYAAQIGEFLSQADLLVAHNSALMLGFIVRELMRYDVKLSAVPTFCTLSASQRTSPLANGSLEAGCSAFGIERPRGLANAFGHAWLTLRLYLSLNGFGDDLYLPDDLTCPPSNLRDAPPVPASGVPSRGLVGLRATA